MQERFLRIKYPNLLKAGIKPRHCRKTLESRNLKIPWKYGNASLNTDKTQASSIQISKSLNCLFIIYMKSFKVPSYLKNNVYFWWKFESFVNIPLKKNTGVEVIWESCLNCLITTPLSFVEVNHKYLPTVYCLWRWMMA